MLKLINFCKKNKFCLALVAIFLIGAFLRFYHFSDWLHFELDQSRDAKIIDLAIENGIGNLPLLGPKAAGSFLRLGPIFYYFNYLSALIFGNTPTGIAIITLIFGILALPIFYLFIREYFDKKISLGLLLIFSTSLFLIIYSRFSWNPNALPLFILLTFFCLLKTVQRDNQRAGWWLIGSAFSLSIASQLHFLAFVSVPMMVFIFLVIKRPRIKFHFWILAFLVIILTYAPAIANDFLTGGKNISQLGKVTQEKSEKNQNALWEKVIRNVKENSLGHFLILSGQRGEFPKFDLRVESFVAYNKKNQSYFFSGILSLLIFILGVWLLFRRLFSEKDTRKKNFLLLNTTWLIIAFGIFTPLAFNISPRFFLVICGLPFVFLGLIWELILKKISAPRAWTLILMIILILTFLNLQKTFQRFSEYAKASKESFEIEPDRFLKEKTRVTLEQQNLIIDYVSSFYQKNNFPIYLNSDPQYRRSLFFTIDKFAIPRDDMRNLSSAKKLYRQGNYFLVYPTLSNWQKDLDKYSESYSLIGKKEFGTLTILHLEPKPEMINEEKQTFEPREKSKSAPGVPERYNWEQIFSETESDDEN